MRGNVRDRVPGVGDFPRIRGRAARRLRPATVNDVTDHQRTCVSEWFRELHGRICKAFEALEGCHEGGPFAERSPGRFALRKTRRRDSDSDGEGRGAGGGLTAMLRTGRVFEKVGINVSTVHGRLGDEARKSLTSRREIPGLSEDPRFWASGVSLVAHLNSPRVPAVHMNTRMFWTPGATWFGGGMDLNPAVENPEDAAAFHRALKAMCDRHDSGYYSRFRAWADEYFLIRHRGEPRGAGGIFFDDLASGDWDADFAFTRDVGQSFLAAYMPIVDLRRNEDWSEDERELQLIRRGRYAEFNLLYDRGTRFGLFTGHDPDAVLMSMPPLASWP